MARVTIEDSLETVWELGGGTFHLIMLASYRAKQLAHGAKPKVAGDNDKPTVLALREIAAGFYDFTDEELPEKDAFGNLVFRKKRDHQKD